MTISYSNLENSKLRNRIDNLLDFTPEIKIQKLAQGAVRVNQYRIENVYGQWICDGQPFFRRKSAVGYALCLIKKDTAKAKTICSLDRHLQKIKTDIDIYHYHMRKAKHNRKIIYSNRISADIPYLYQADSELTSVLKTVEL